MTVIATDIRALGTIPKGLIKGTTDIKVRKQVETIQTTALQRSARILRRVLETWGDLLSLRLQGNTSANAGVENLLSCKIMRYLFPAFLSNINHFQTYFYDTRIRFVFAK